MAVEREAALIVVAADPGRTLRRLAALRRLDGFELRARDPERIRDTYLDTPDGRLGARHIALRTRETGHGTFVTLKSGEGERGGVHARSELELPLTVGNAARVLRELTRLGVRAPLPSARDIASRRWNEAEGLAPSQVRSTRRLRRAIARLEPGPPRVVAELAVDRVTYEFGRRRVTMDEVEVEAKGRGTADDVRDFLRVLRARFGRELRPWPWSKLATGKALEARHQHGRLTPLVTRAHLKPTAVPALERQLRKR